MKPAVLAATVAIVMAALDFGGCQSVPDDGKQFDWRQGSPWQGWRGDRPDSGYPGPPLVGSKS